MKRQPLLSLLLACCLVSAAAAQLPRIISYQGVLTDDVGSAVPDGFYNVVFKLYEEELGGAEVWSITRDVMVEKGIFNVALGSIQPLDIPFDKPYWLGMAVAGEPELFPRVQLMAVPYSLNSWGVVGETNFFPPAGNVGIGTPGPLERLDVDGAIRIGGTDGMNPGTIRWTGTDFEGFMGVAWQSLTGGSGGSLPVGSEGQTLRHNGSAWAPSSLLYNDGTHIGIGTTTPDHTLHVNGLARFDLPFGQIAISTPGGWPGLIAYSNNGHRRDIVYDDSRMFLAASPSATAPTDDNGIVLNENGQICIGTDTPSEKLHIQDTGPTYVNIDAPTGYASGVILSENGTAQWRLLYDPAEGTVQMYREGSGAKMVIGNGGRVGIGTTILHGDAWLEVHSPNPTPGKAAIIGYSYFNQSPSWGGGIAVAGIHSDDQVGGTGVYGSATDGGAMQDSQVGVYGYTDDGYGVYSDGTLGSTGPIVAVAPTEDYGHRKVYSVQSAENWFEDFGEGRLSGGEATVEIDPVFAQTVNLGETYHVFLTPVGDCGLYVSEKTSRSFTVRAGDGKPVDIAFDYRIVAKRSGFESKRLEAAKDPEMFRQRHRAGLGAAVPGAAVGAGE
ncbi:MAG: hypothetical protein PHQ19_01835 [Candidatus Krumholzibacteria bacterium]|nr:hypothetical protein [Candidatus Krumholzibacteria bacterium]